MILVDTPPHGEYCSSITGVPVERFRVLWLGAQEEVFFPREEIVPEGNVAMFHGTFIPLQGLETILRAAKELEGDDIEVRIFGDGQEREAADRLVQELELRKSVLRGMIPLSEVPAEIARATVCLGIFGTTAKAARVVPNKLFECLAVGRPVVTGDTPAIRSAFNDEEVIAVPPGNPEALAGAVRGLCFNREQREEVAASGHKRYREAFSQESLSRLLRNHLEEVMAPRTRGQGR